MKFMNKLNQIYDKKILFIFFSKILTKERLTIIYSNYITPAHKRIATQTK